MFLNDVPVTDRNSSHEEIEKYTKFRKETCIHLSNEDIERHWTLEKQPALIKRENRGNSINFFCST